MDYGVKYKGAVHTTLVARVHVSGLRYYYVHVHEYDDTYRLICTAGWKLTPGADAKREEPPVFQNDLYCTGRPIWTNDTTNQLLTLLSLPMSCYEL